MSLGLYPLYASNHPVPLLPQLWQPKMSPDIHQCFSGGPNHPAENHCHRQVFAHLSMVLSWEAALKVCRSPLELDILSSAPEKPSEYSFERKLTFSFFQERPHQKSVKWNCFPDRWENDKASSKKTRNKKRSYIYVVSCFTALGHKLVVKGWESGLNCDPKEPGPMCPLDQPSHWNE